MSVRLSFIISLSLVAEIYPDGKAVKHKVDISVVLCNLVRYDFNKNNTRKMVYKRSGTFQQAIDIPLL